MMNKQLKTIGFVLIGIALLSFTGHLVIEVVEGRGGDIYKSYKGLNFIPIGVLILIVSIPFFILLARIIGWFYMKEERDFIAYVERKKLTIRDTR